MKFRLNNTRIDETRIAVFMLAAFLVLSPHDAGADAMPSAAPSAALSADTAAAQSAGPSSDVNGSDAGIAPSTRGAATLPTTAGLTQIEKAFSGGASSEVLRNLKQFGYDLFQRETEPFTPAQNIPVDPDYVLGIGDEVVIHLWGKIVQQTIPLTVDRDGGISLPKQGPVHVRGLSLVEAQELIAKAITHHYANCEVSVTLGKLRAIDVFVLGEVTTPGRYKLNSLSTILHALYASGGPTSMGTLRKVKLLRNGNLKAEMDLYDLLLNGTNEHDVRLSSGDTVFVPRIGSVVGVAGFIKVPGIYEMSGGMSLAELFRLAGGFTPASYRNRVQIERTSEEGRRIVRDVEISDLESLADSKSNLTLQDGDLVQVFPINFNRHGYVAVSGNVARPGQYEFTAGMRVGELIRKAGGLVKGAYMARADLIRFMDRGARNVLPVDLSALVDGDRAADVQLQEWDELRVYTESDIQPAQTTRISGAVVKPGEYALRPFMTLDDLIFLAGGSLPYAHLKHVEVHRRGAVADAPAEVMTLDLTDPLEARTVATKTLADTHDVDEATAAVETLQTLKNRANPRLLSLHHGDHVFIRSRKPTADKQVVELRGEIMFPGPYVIQKGETLGALIRRAGGPTENAYLPGLHFSRAAVRDRQQRHLDRIVRLQNEALMRAQVAYHEQESRNGNIRESSDVDGELRLRQGLLQLIGEFKPTGRVLVDVSNDLDQFVGAVADPLLRDGDLIDVPSVPATVAVVGAVIQPQDILYTSRERPEHYMAQCGGMTDHADDDGVYIVRANGSIDKGRKQFMFQRAPHVNRGDTIVVPDKHRIRRYPGGMAVDVISSIYQLTIGAAVLDGI